MQEAKKILAMNFARFKDIKCENLDSQYELVLIAALDSMEEYAIEYHKHKLLNILNIVKS